VTGAADWRTDRYARPLLKFEKNDFQFTRASSARVNAGVVRASHVCTPITGERTGLFDGFSSYFHNRLVFIVRCRYTLDRDNSHE